ncbi:hypothetical protein DASC09_018660 [Saccharomycopsis crataegensis]|uniref:Eukaryotic translation initiation factor 2A n=1 Tax=Saccharomycopsis crataegensis TaxID=43959 RepID=A0AAV5QIN7_9ASCO|nr:hypothetical protein DASC09_018660 [Saccharomycopsis crataegensis]
MSVTTQFYYRNPKSVGLSSGNPSYEQLKAFASPSDIVRAACYSPDGSLFAYTQPDCVTITNPDTGAVVVSLSLKDVFDLHFSPSGSYLAVWAKPIRSVADDGSNNVIWSKNVKIFDIQKNLQIAEYTAKAQGGWKPQFTADEKIMTKLYPNQVRFYELDGVVSINFDKPSFILQIEDISAYALSPGKNPAIAVFVAEKKGKPAFVKVFNVSANGFNQPLCFKSFFKAERCVLKWNSLGTAILALASTDVDSSNKSYYGETALYLLGIAGAYNPRITLDKEGPIHDINWSPSSREFGVIYGYMPSQTSFFDARGNLIYSLPPSPRNTLLFSPHAKFVLVAGFGNLQGTVDIYDRTKKFSKITSFEASNTSVCHWSPCGRFILTATTSPRLRVDNGIKVWHASGKLVYLTEFKELFAVDWRPQPVSSFPPLKNLENDVVAHQSAQEHELQKATKIASSVSDKPKATGAYRPPHARNSSSNGPAKTLYEKELSSKIGATYKPPTKPKSIPGAAPAVVQESKAAAKNRKKKEAKKAAKEKEEPTQPSSADNSESSNSSAPITGGSIVGGVVSLEEKKIRSLLKKLRAIETLKMKQAAGDNLEDTQVLKIKTEEKVRSDLRALGWKDE